MKIKQTCNGNIDGKHQYNKLISTVLINPESRDWVAVNNLNSLQCYDNRRESAQYVANIKTNSQFIECSESFNSGEQLVPSTGTQLVCNQQYRLSELLKVNASLLDITSPVKLESTKFGDDLNKLSSETLAHDEQEGFHNTDIDEMQERGVKGAPRGIVNPNYPGFQHLAHTLQDYSLTIENFYHSENDMTDDDIEITDLSYEADAKSDMSTACINNNNTFTGLDEKNIEKIKSVSEDNLDQIRTDIPDLIKTVTQKTNIDAFYDIENNFRTHDIIGDFNKEIEDEIKSVLNYNLNIDNDLEELRKEIKDNFEKPIVNTINNISDVVNHVIKKLVETQCIENELNFQRDAVERNLNTSPENSIRDNELNSVKEMNRNRPTFLYIDNNINSAMVDAFLSDGKEDINICEQDYDTDKLTDNVENTIKQLSVELRKIIPKLEEMRERDKMFSVINESKMTVIDSNSNQIPSCDDCNRFFIKSTSKKEFDRQHEENQQIKTSINERRPQDPNTLRDQAIVSPEPSCSIQSISSVPKKHPKEECYLGSFDVYNIETALPKIDLDAIESHLKAAKEAERRKRNDREEIRRRLAMGTENEENYYSLGHVDRPGRKPSLQQRLQSGMNLQICFMNETASDNESQASEIEKPVNSNSQNLTKSSIFSKSNFSLNNHPYQTRPLSVSVTKQDKIGTVQSGSKLRPSSLSLKTPKSRSTNSLGHIELRESDFHALQATLQTEARIALASAKEMARVEMDRSRRARGSSPVTDMLRRSLLKARAPLPADRRRASRHFLTDMNIAQLQVIVNELHSQIESLNESLVQLLMARDELHMGQDAMLVDIEDLTRYLGVKEQNKKAKGTNKSAVGRLATLVSK